MVEDERGDRANDIESCTSSSGSRSSSSDSDDDITPPPLLLVEDFVPAAATVGSDIPQRPTTPPPPEPSWRAQRHLQVDDDGSPMRGRGRRHRRRPASRTRELMYRVATDDVVAMFVEEERRRMRSNDGAADMIALELGNNADDDDNNNSSSDDASGDSRMDVSVRPVQQRRRRRWRRNAQRWRQRWSRILCFPIACLSSFVMLLFLFLFGAFPLFIFIVLLVCVYYCCTHEPIPPRVLLRALLDMDGDNAGGPVAAPLTPQQIESCVIRRLCLGAWLCLDDDDHDVSDALPVKQHQMADCRVYLEAEPADDNGEQHDDTGGRSSAGAKNIYIVFSSPFGAAPVRRHRVPDNVRHDDDDSDDILESDAEFSDSDSATSEDAGMEDTQLSSNAPALASDSTIESEPGAAAVAATSDCEVNVDDDVDNGCSCREHVGGKSDEEDVDAKLAASISEPDAADAATKKNVAVTEETRDDGVAYGSTTLDAVSLSTLMERFHEIAVQLMDRGSATGSSEVSEELLSAVTTAQDWASTLTRGEATLAPDAIDELARQLKVVEEQLVVLKKQISPEQASDDCPVLAPRWREGEVSSLASSTGSSSVRPSDTNVTCDICLLSYDEGDTVVWSNNPKCQHHFHQQCISVWLTRKPTCPSCRQQYVLLGKDSEPAAPSSPGPRGRSSNAASSPNATSDPSLPTPPPGDDNV